MTVMAASQQFGFLRLVILKDWKIRFDLEDAHSLKGVVRDMWKSRSIIMKLQRVHSKIWKKWYGIPTIFCLKTLILDINFKWNYRHNFKKKPYNDSYFCHCTIFCIMSFDYYRGSSLKTIWSHNFNGRQSSQSQGSFIMHFGSCNKKNLKTDLFLIHTSNIISAVLALFLF